MTEIKQKLWNGRKVKEELIAKKPEGVTFGALYGAQEVLTYRGYTYGSLDGGRVPSNPIAIVKGRYNLPQKWHNLTKEQKLMCDGVLISDDWREGEVKIILFEDKTIL